MELIINQKYLDLQFHLAWPIGATLSHQLSWSVTVLFLGVLAKIHNPQFNSIEFEGIKNDAGRNAPDFNYGEFALIRSRVAGMEVNT